MYKIIKVYNNATVRVGDGRSFLIKSIGKNIDEVYLLDINGEIQKQINFLHNELSWKKFIYRGQWFVTYNTKSLLSDTLNVFSIDGDQLASIKELDGFPTIFPVGDNKVYLAHNNLVLYDMKSFQFENFGTHELGNNLICEGVSNELIFMTKGWRKELIALRDKNGQGLEEVYRIDFSESDKWNGIFGDKEELGRVEFLNLFKDDIWVTTQQRLHRIKASTGQTIEIRDYTIPKLLIDGHMGYSLNPTRYRIMDMELGKILMDRKVDKFSANGEEFSCQYRSYLFYEGYIYASIRLSCGLFGIVVFDTRSEVVVWHDIWSSDSPIRSIHLIDDRLIADSFDEVRIYARCD